MTVNPGSTRALTTEPLLRLDTLTGLRFVAALLVFISHTGPVFEDAGVSPARALAPLGFIGVSFFFVLSGFVLTWSASTDATKLTFLRRRAARILPVYWFAFGATSLLFAARENPLSLGQLTTSFFLVQAWVPDLTIFWGLNSVAWTLSCEAFFYAMAPWVLPALIALSPANARRVLVALVAAVFLAAVALPSNDFESTNFWLNYIFPPMRMLEFMIGSLLAVEVRRGRWHGARLYPSLIVAAAACVVAPLVPMSFSKASLTLVPFMSVIAAAARLDLAARPCWFRHHWWIALGMWSYVFYLVHIQVIEEVARVLGGDIDGLVTAGWVAALAFVATVTLSWFLYRLVERPAERVLRR